MEKLVCVWWGGREIRREERRQKNGKTEVSVRVKEEKRGRKEGRGNGGVV